jgi:uncharacterized protein with NRDE domain
MCLVALALDCHPEYLLAIAANRDEFHQRASVAASPWPDAPWVHGGIDRSSGGSWMAATSQGRVALVTNIRRSPQVTGLSRGLLVRELMLDTDAASTVLQRVQQRAALHSPFNLISGDLDRLHWLSSELPATPLSAGRIHTLSNASLDTAWPKTQKLRLAMESWCGTAAVDLEPLFTALLDNTQAPDDELPATGIGVGLERYLSSAFIVGDRYGTRCSSVYTIDRGGQARFQERRFGPNGRPEGRSDLRWEINSQR